MDPARFLLMDFGTTSLKTAIVDLDTGRFSQVRSFPSLPKCSDASRRYEVSPAALTDRFVGVCDLYFNQLGIAFAGIALCSEQNGFLVLDEHNEPASCYVSWKDERSLDVVDGVATFDLVRDRLGGEFHAITGWRPGPNLPLMNVAHLGRLEELPRGARIVALPEWLALCSGDSEHVAHDTMQHCLGFYDVRARATSAVLTAFVAELTGVRCEFNPIAPTGTVSGYWRNGERRIPIYAGVGDHQCSVLGACNAPRETISLNMGTGSQVAVIDAVSDLPPEFELRPYFDDRLLPVVTRIPAGRALANFVGLLEEAARSAGGEADFWGMLAGLTEADLAGATLDFDLAVFGSAWNYRGGGQIGGIADGSLTLKNYLASLFKSWVAQYPDVIRLFDPRHEAARCVLSGGLPRRLPLLARVLADMSGYDIWPACDVDESLLGLRTVLLVSAGRARSCLEGQAVYERSAEVV